MGDATFVLTLLSALGCGLAAGVFFAFSTYVMPAWGRLPAAQGIAAMNAINVVAPRPFVLAQGGAAAVCVAAAVAVLLDWDAAYGWYVLAGTLLYVLSIVVLTGGYHVPRNNELARAEGEPGAPETWARYQREWTAANHLRAVGPLIACALMALALAAG